MPQITIYVSNEIYISFLEKAKEERTRIRQEACNTIKQEVNKKIEQPMG
ncbi:hypothetical protein LCGC14_1678530 [marine sediment metagenome]|uniref:Uncharacterized protein n=1 Tax=marine sediment metagenome TaxID=412755 RepID=A0A0F9IBQ4_9ZZZZ